MDIRRATASDLDAVVAIVESQRRQYQKFQPIFWRKAANSAATTRAFFTKLLRRAAAPCFLVAVEGSQILGFLIARKFPAPPVYAPGGDTYLIDDFAVLDPWHWLVVERGAAVARVDADARSRRGADRSCLRRPRSCQDRIAAPDGPRDRLELVDQVAALEKLQLEGQAPFTMLIWGCTE